MLVDDPMVQRVSFRLRAWQRRTSWGGVGRTSRWMFWSGRGWWCWPGIGGAPRVSWTSWRRIAIATVVFCEVKTRSGEGFGSPFEAVTQAKRRKLRRLAVLWLTANPVKVFPAMRFDVIGVLWRPGAAPVVEHRAEAF